MPLIINQVTELTFLCYDLCLFVTVIIGINTFNFTCAMRYFKPLIINQVTELTWLTMTCVCL